MAGTLPRSWKQVLRLQELPVNGALIGPPLQPPGLELMDPAAERRRWRGLLGRHTRSLAPGPQPDSLPVSRMMALLLEYQNREDAMTARHLSEVRG